MIQTKHPKDPDHLCVHPSLSSGAKSNSCVLFRTSLVLCLKNRDMFFVDTLIKLHYNDKWFIKMAKDLSTANDQDSLD